MLAARALVVLALVVSGLSGCSLTAPSLELDPKWSPLERVVEDSSQVLAKGITTTRGHVAYVNDLPGWLHEGPLGSPQSDALLAHEQVHARRQLDMGLDAWLVRARSDKAFLLAEEELGYAIELLRLREAGKIVDIEQVAELLAGPVYGNMISLESARAWVRSVMEGP